MIISPATVEGSPLERPYDLVGGPADHLAPEQQAREALHKILANPAFEATSRSRRMLEYLVTEALEGRGPRIKAYSIATEVLGRPESFDPQKDPIVRIEAARLRKALELYYLTDGRADPVIIEIPKGAYVPIFKPSGFRPEQTEGKDGRTSKPARGRASAPMGRMGVWGLTAGLAAGLLMVGLSWSGAFKSETATRTTAQLQGPRLIINPLTDLMHSGESDLVAQGLTERIIEKTSRFSELEVVAGNDQQARIPATEARYEFAGTLRVEGGQLLLQSRLVDRTDGRVIWADSFDVEMKAGPLFDVENRIADQIATKIAEPNGIVFDAERRLLQETPPENWNTYLCTLQAYAYRASYSATQHAPVRACLEKAVAEFPNYPTGWALLSLAYLDEVRFFYPPPAGNEVPALTRAYEAARRAVKLDASNIRAQQALMMALFFRGDHAAAVAVGTKALNLNPNDIEFKGDFGHRLALSGDWERGCGLIEEVMRASLRKVAYYKIGMSLCHYFRNDAAAAADLIRDTEASENPAYHIIAAAILAEAGAADEAEEHVAWLRKEAPQQLPRLLADLPKRLGRPEDRQRFIGALRKAGFATGS